MPYFIETFERPGTGELRAEVRPRHLDYLASIGSRLLACGAKLDERTGAATGSVYLVDVGTRDAAQAIVDADPFAEAGLIERVRVEPFRVAVLDGTSRR